MIPNNSPYTPPPDGKKWIAVLGLFHCGLNGAEFKLALYLIHKANPKTGQSRNKLHYDRHRYGRAHD
jgi:hypothetical protein